MTKFCNLCMSSQFNMYVPDNTHSVSKCRFLIGREKPGVESEVARLISETLEQEKSTQNQDDDTTDQEDNGEMLTQPQEPEPEEQTDRIPQEHDPVKHEVQQLAGEKDKSTTEEVRERWLGLRGLLPYILGVLKLTFVCLSFYQYR